MTRGITRTYIANSNIALITIDFIRLNDLDFEDVNMTF